MNAGGDQSVRAWRCSALMRVRFEIDVERSTAGTIASVLEGPYFSVFHALIAIGASARDDALRIDDDRADVRTG